MAASCDTISMLNAVSEDKKRLLFLGGIAGALLPFLLFIVGVAWIALSGAPDERGFWPILILALATGLFLARDKKQYCEAVIDGMSERLVMIMIVAWTLASIIGILMSITGLVEGLSWLASQANLGGRGMIVASFLICCAVAISTGSSFATILICGPILYPSAGMLGADLPTLAGAILAGATFGDCIAPISDTTIAAATSQNTDIAGTVLSRLKYVIPVGVVALVAYYFFGSSVAGAVAIIAPQGSPRGLPMLLVPILIIYLFLRRKHLMHGLLAGLCFGVILGLVLGLLSPGQLLSLDLNNFTAKSFVIDGVNRAVGISFFTILLMGLVGALKASGLLDRLVGFASQHSTTEASGEWWIVGTVSAAVLLTTHSVVAILMSGDFANSTGEDAQIHPYRRANLLSMVVCIFPFLLPYFIPVILMSNTTVLGPEYNLASVSPIAVGLHNFVAWGLLAMVLIAVVFGYGRASKKLQGRNDNRELTN